MLPEEKDVADILRRIQGLATKSNLTIQRFQPGKVVQQKLYAEIPYKLQAEGTYHNLGYFFDQISKFPRIINVSEISIKAKTPPEPNATIMADLTATTFVLQEAKAAPADAGARCRSSRRSESRPMTTTFRQIAFAAVACALAVVAARSRRRRRRRSHSHSRSRLPRLPSRSRRCAAGSSRRTPISPKDAAIRSSACSRAAAIPRRRPTGRPVLPGLLINEIVVKGIVRDRSGFIAMIQGPDTKTHIVRAGDKLMDGTVKSITSDTVVFSQDVNDPLSLVKQREVRKAVRPVEGGRG